MPEWKWEEIDMNFIVGLSKTHSGYDSIWVIVDRLTKVAHFIPVKTTYSALQLVELYMLTIVCSYGVPKKIVSDRVTQFTSKFWEMLHEILDTQLRFNSAYHSQTDGQIERVNQVLEEMLRACALQYGRSLDRCQTPLFWSEAGERKVFGPDILQETEKQVHMVRQNLRVA
jgi:hypothetical protein